MRLHTLTIVARLRIGDFQTALFGVVFSCPIGNNWQKFAHTGGMTALYEYVETTDNIVVWCEQAAPCTGKACEAAILDCASIVEGEDLVVAVVFAPLFGRSARQEAMRSLALRYKSAGAVYVTCDLDLYRKVQRGESGNLRATILSRHSGVVVT